MVHAPVNGGETIPSAQMVICPSMGPSISSVGHVTMRQICLAIEACGTVDFESSGNMWFSNAEEQFMCPPTGAESSAESSLDLEEHVAAPVTYLETLIKVGERPCPGRCARCPCGRSISCAIRLSPSPLPPLLLPGIRLLSRFTRLVSFGASVLPSERSHPTPCRALLPRWDCGGGCVDWWGGVDWASDGLAIACGAGSIV